MLTGDEHRKHSITFLVYPVPKFLGNASHWHRGATNINFTMRHNLSLSSKMLPWFRTRVSEYGNLQFVFSWRCCSLVDKQPSRQLRTKPIQLTLAHLASRAGEAPCVGRLTQKYPKKGRNSQKIVQYNSRNPKCCTLAPISASIQSEEQQWRSNRGCRAAARAVTEWHKEQEQPSQCCPCQISTASPQRNAQALGWAQAVLTKPRLWFWSLVVPFPGDGLNDPCGTLPTQNILRTPWR